ncbi:MAG: hypothetical protein A2Y76_08290 [Planctomycetes bacterium RBG_13_60_9]|nr:MAG: hypothetical protein A2Y76_08290 [Planctomycetes bacterium RBG_13_60_9]
MSPGEPRDMVILVADKNMEAAVRGLLSRQQPLNIRRIDAEVLRHPQRDSGCCNSGVEFLSAFTNQFAHAMLMFDREGCGRDDQAPENIEQSIEERLSGSGWNSRAKAVVLDPELEIWVWSASPHVEECLGWRSCPTPLRQWLLDQGYLHSGEAKPVRPKEAMEAALYASRTPRSSAIYRHLAERVSLRGCADRAFLKFRDVLQQWFGSNTSPG